MSRRLVDHIDDHLGTLFLGSRSTYSPTIDNAEWVQFIPPFAMMWDYHPPRHGFLESETLAPVYDDWEQKNSLVHHLDFIQP